VPALLQYALASRVVFCVLGIFIIFPLISSPGYLLGGGDSDDTGEDHPYVTIDAWNRIKVEPHIMTRGFPYEQLYVIEDWGSAKDWKSNGTHVYVPYDNGTNPIQAKYIVDRHAEGDFEIGISIQTMSYNMFGAISPTIKLGTAENMHVFKTGQALDSRIFDSARADVHNQWRLTRWIASTFVAPRRYLTCLFLHGEHGGITDA